MNNSSVVIVAQGGFGVSQTSFDTIDQDQVQVQCEAQFDLQAQEQQVHLYQKRESVEMVQN